MDLIVNFPKDYPLKPLSVVVPDDQNIPKACISSLNSTIMESSVTRSSGSLMLRPFLHWLDKVITMVVMESLPEDSYGSSLVMESDPADDPDTITQQLSVVDLDERAATDVCYSEEEDNEEGGEGEEEKEREDEVDDSETNKGLDNVTKLTAAKRGTEIRLKDLLLGQYVGTAVFPNLKLVAECTRCNCNQDMTVTAEK